MKKRDLILDALYEIKHLRKHATKEELSMLNFESFNPSSGVHCIYGQMTGLCNSDRAEELYPKKYDEIYCGDYDGDIDIFIRKLKIENVTSFTPLEVFISLGYEDQNENIIKFLKGEIDDLKLEIE